ncbi:hypothetical protein [Candidatus Solincola tengchongensis]|uniref:hypothetical protein n=1 Tax=Candidatus Solincola tengchongensis TaxID=2900693 RepID=UPI002580AF81|nr:hypothetical protein [Candidatus Solincola tengchongensis]
MRGSVPSEKGIRNSRTAIMDTTCLPATIPPPVKLIVHSRDREEAIRIMRQALLEFEIEGVSTLIPFHLRLLSNPDFLAGNYHTRWVEQGMF